MDEIFLNLLKKIKFHLINNKLIRETGFEIFENEWVNFKSSMSIIVESLISKPYLIIPFNLEDIIEGKDIFLTLKFLDYPKILRLHKNEIEYFRSNLLMFLLHSELNFYLDPNNNSSISQSFPLKLSGVNIEIDNEYPAQSKVFVNFFSTLR